MHALRHPIFLDHFIANRGCGIEGAAYALACTYSVMNALVILHIKFNRPTGPPSKTWIFFFDGVHHPDSLGLDLSVTEVLAPQQTKDFVRNFPARLPPFLGGCSELRMHAQVHGALFEHP